MAIEDASSSSATSDIKQNTTPNFFSLLKDYKELISIIIFFLGGISWVLGYFATKAEVRKVECLVDATSVLMNNEKGVTRLGQERARILRGLEEAAKAAEANRTSLDQLYQLRNEMDVITQRQNNSLRIAKEAEERIAKRCEQEHEVESCHP